MCCISFHVFSVCGGVSHQGRCGWHLVAPCCYWRTIHDTSTLCLCADANAVAAAAADANDNNGGAANASFIPSKDCKD